MLLCYVFVVCVVTFFGRGGESGIREKFSNGLPLFVFFELLCLVVSLCCVVLCCVVLFFREADRERVLCCVVYSMYRVYVSCAAFCKLYFCIVVLCVLSCVVLCCVSKF